MTQWGLLTSCTCVFIEFYGVCLDGEELEVVHVSLTVFASRWSLFGWRGVVSCTSICLHCDTVGFAWMEMSCKLYMCLHCDTVGFAWMEKS